MYKTKLFKLHLPAEGGSDEVNKWLEQNSNIVIISTNSFASGWGYIILYKESDSK